MQKFVLVSCLAVLLQASLSAQSVSINNTGAAPDAKSMLDVSSTTKGMLIPRMTQAERDAIGTPPNGLLLYNTSTNSFQYYNSSTWTNITNSGIVTGTNNKVPRFVGLWGLANGIMMDDGNGVAINATSTVANSSAILDMTSTSKGILIPRMNSSQRTAILTPATGLLVFDTDLSGFMFYNGSTWTAIGGGGSADWTANGNDIYNSNSGNVGIGVQSPLVRLAVDSSIMLDADNSNDNTLNKGALLFGTDKKVGIYRNTLPGFASRSGLSFTTNGIRRLLIDSLGRVGINTSSPTTTLYVNGTTSLLGNVGIGTSTPDYGIENVWGYTYLYYGVGIGPGITPSSAWMLDVGGGDVRFRSDLRVNGTATIDGTAAIAGSATVNGGKGVAYNGGSATNLRITPFTTANFHAVLGPHGSAETTIGLPAGFTSTPRVFVGSIRSTGGTAGELNRVILVLWGCDTNSCIAKIINTDNVAVDYNITWDCLAVGN